ncbi:uncharacterized protein LOC110856975 [Folsomia candida]|uniref:uncharacterized protein LOC110856975 n=1 Tax=Folsomia candida TaxID=158441 RepID=UPI000B90030A|nr:uncharacterized protein LOC110856975 [Folsomia candida]
MPVVNLLTSAASFLYAVSSMLSGVPNNAAIQTLPNFQSPSNNILPVGQWRSSKSNNYDLGNSQFGGGSPSHNATQTEKGPYSVISSTIYFPANAGGGYGQSPPSEFDKGNTVLPDDDLIQPPIEINYHDGETIATLFTDLYGNVTRCEMLEVNKPSEQQEALEKLAKQNKLIEKTNFNQMLNIIRSCQALDDRDDGRSQPLDPFESIVQSKSNMWNIGILPGTKWCGVKDVADGWNDLGPEKDLDKCCRSHDLCPRKVLAFRAAYNLVNWSFYTKSHCECDAAFYDCLKQASSTNPTAELMGNFYFNVLRMQCIDEEHPPRCVLRNSEDSQSCTRWENDYSRATQRLTFREVRQMFK